PSTKPPTTLNSRQADRRWSETEAGPQPVTVHSSIDVTTNTYMEVIESVQRDALDALMPLLFGERNDGKRTGNG
ncbi:hypothetical protein AB0M34_30405, partial [Nocardia sp. NPDC050193]